MKKHYFFFFLIICLFPFSVKAENYGLERFYMNVNVNENGNLIIEEFFEMNGSYNGFGRTIHPANYGLRTFTGVDEDFGGSTIYNGTGMELLEVGGVPLQKISFGNLENTFNQIRQNVSLFQNVPSAVTGDFGVYTTSTDFIKIFNPDKKMGFYLKYVLTDMVILHDDVAEFGWTIFSTEMQESIKDFKVFIHLPNNQNELRAFAHGPLTGNITLQGKTGVLLEVNGLPAYQPVDTRIVFDTFIVPLATKKTNMSALDKILKYEGTMAKDANLQREAARKAMADKKRMSYIVTFGIILWVIGAILFAIFYYLKFDKEYKSTFRGKYFRDFPSDLAPEIVGYLMHHKIDANDLSASILNMIYKKKIAYEKLEKDYRLILLDNNVVLTPSEEKAIAFIFDGNSKISMKEFKKQASSGHVHFLDLFNKWLFSASSEASKYNFFVKPGKMKLYAYVYAFMGAALLIYTMSFTMFLFINIITLIIDGIFFLYISSSHKRTVTGNEEYHKWLGLKNFMNDFGNFEKRELPQIELWEKYMVYAVTFGVAKKLSKQMKIKINEYNLDSSSIYYGNDNFFIDMLYLNSIISHDVVSAHSSAITAQNIASSSNSSSGGFGGGFSSGGGSFGGGGGGGRF